MSLKILQMGANAVRSMMSNPIAKTVGIGAVFAAGTYVGANWNNIDSFEKKTQTEVVENTNEVQELNETESNNTLNLTQDGKPILAPKTKELKNIARELNSATILNQKNTKVSEMSLEFDSQDLTGNTYDAIEGTINYNNQKLKVVMSGDNNNYDKNFYDSNNNLIYSLMIREGEIVTVQEHKYDSNGRKAEYNTTSRAISPGNQVSKYTYTDTPEGLKEEHLKISDFEETKNIRTKSMLNSTTTLYKNSDNTFEYKIKDKNGHTLVQYTCKNPPVIEKERIIKDDFVTYKYNKEGLLEARIFDNGVTETFKYDSKGNVIEAYVKQKNNHYHKNTFEYDHNNNLINTDYEDNYKK